MSPTVNGKAKRGYWLWVDAVAPTNEGATFIWWGDEMYRVSKCIGCGRHFAMENRRTGRVREYCTHICAATFGRQVKRIEARVRP